MDYDFADVTADLPRCIEDIYNTRRFHQRSSRITTLADGQNRRVILSGSSGLSNLPVCIGLAGDTSVTPHHW
jgi:hypothetical protein